jgi:hypothetical protein
VSSLVGLRCLAALSLQGGPDGPTYSGTTHRHRPIDGWWARATPSAQEQTVEEIWPRADRQHCAVHRLRNIQAKLPKSEHDRVRFNYWSALNDATSVKDGKLRLQVLINDLEHAGYQSAARCLAEDLDALVVHLALPPQTP